VSGRLHALATLLLGERAPCTHWVVCVCVRARVCKSCKCHNTRHCNTCPSRCEIKSRK